MAQQMTIPQKKAYALEKAIAILGGESTAEYVINEASKIFCWLDDDKEVSPRHINHQIRCDIENLASFSEEEHRDLLNYVGFTSENDTDPSDSIPEKSVSNPSSSS